MELISTVKVVSVLSECTCCGFVGEKKLVNIVSPTSDQDSDILRVLVRRFRDSCGALYFCGKGNISAFYVKNENYDGENSTEIIH